MKTKEVVLVGVKPTNEERILKELEEHKKQGWTPVNETYNQETKEFRIFFQKD